MSKKRAAPAPKVITLPIEKLRLDGGTQPRMELVESAVEDYGEAYREGESLPPVKVMRVGKDYYLFDGFHRVEALKRNKARTVRAEVSEGTLNDAIWLAAGTNKSHGLRRTNEDKQNAVRMALACAAQMSPPPSSRQIAEHVGVSHPMVEKYREDPTGKLYQLNERGGADGRKRKSPTRGPKDTTAAPPVASGEPVRDQLGQEITDPEIAAAFTKLAPRLIEVAGHVTAARRAWGSFHDELLAAKHLRIVRARSYFDVRPVVEENTKQLAYNIASDAPYAICPYCQGAPCPEDITKRCRGCGGGGWIDKSGYDNAPPEKKLRPTTKPGRGAPAEVSHV